MSKKEEKAVLEDLDFKCSSCGSCFCEESQWIAGLLESRTATCPSCGAELLLGKEEEGKLAAFMKKKDRFGKAMFVFMCAYSLGGLVVSLLFGGLGFVLYMPVGLVAFTALKMSFDSRSDLSIRLEVMT
ncbi:MAG: hypothetical protein ACXIU5_16885 [Halomonadaceae bacterium]|uniref:hypothetical protein n=1 Tax=Halomonas sp. MCCC 1A11062 TaxID=2733485 RepID=UPI001F246BF1|nr:hypothetical protein [Halomonas sp. MCCC 1A11062]MCE8036114.1 hypothetical protein [Halomonas sp. MCCC 1A11062]